MYAQSVIDAAQARLEAAYQQAFPTGIPRYPVATCATMAARLASVWDPKTKQPTRRLTPEEDRFIAGERLLGKIDFRYFAERYFFINAGGAGLQRLYPLWLTQELVLRQLAALQEDRLATGHPDGLLINCLKARQGGLCLDPETRVLTTDLRWVRLKDVRVGLALLGTDEFPPMARVRKGGRRFRASLVTATATVFEPAFRLVLDNGESVVATAPHRFLCRKRGNTLTEWRAVGAMQIGDVIRSVTQPWDAGDFEDGWVGGLLDGEGSLRPKTRAGVELTCSQRPGAVFDRLRGYLYTRGYTAREELDYRGKQPNGGKFSDNPVGRVVLGRLDELLRLVGQTRPTRFLTRPWWEGKELPGKHVGGGWAAIVSITALGPRQMIDLQTSTKTFIAEGLVSHNSTLGAALCTHRVVTQTHVRALLASDVPDNSGSEGLFGMYERLIANLPWWLAPSEQFHAKNQHVIFHTGSAILVESGKSMKGGLQDKGGSKGQLGRSKTFSVVHLTELSTWEAPEQIDDALMPAVPRSARTLGVKESTAKGRHNWHHQDWLLGERGRGRWTNVFIPWYADEAKYWLPAPVDWIPNEDTLAEARKAEVAGPRYLHRPVTLSRNQLYWWEETRAAYAEKGELAKFLEEYASDPESCFQAAGRSIFTLDQLQYLRRIAHPVIDIWRVDPAKDLAPLHAAELQHADQRRQAAAAAEVARRERMRVPPIEEVGERG